MIISLTDILFLSVYLYDYLLFSYLRFVPRLSQSHLPVYNSRDLYVKTPYLSVLLFVYPSFHQEVTNILIRRKLGTLTSGSGLALATRRNNFELISGIGCL